MYSNWICVLSRCYWVTEFLPQMCPFQLCPGWRACSGRFKLPGSSVVAMSAEKSPGSPWPRYVHPMSLWRLRMRRTGMGFDGINPSERGWISNMGSFCHIMLLLSMFIGCIQGFNQSYWPRESDGGDRGKITKCCRFWLLVFCAFCSCVLDIELLKLKKAGTWVATCCNYFIGDHL